MAFFKNSNLKSTEAPSGFRALSNTELSEVSGGDYGACIAACVEKSGNTSNKQVEICSTQCLPPPGSGSGSGSGSGR